MNWPAGMSEKEKADALAWAKEQFRTTPGLDRTTYITPKFRVKFSLQDVGRRPGYQADPKGTREAVGEAIADLLILKAGRPLTEGKWKDRYTFLLKSLEREVNRFLELAGGTDKLPDQTAQGLWTKIGEHSMELHQLYDQLDHEVKGAS